jgi:hypothetical protein
MKRANEVTHQGKLTAAAEGVTSHCRYHRFATGRQPQPFARVEVVEKGFLVTAECCHFRNISASRESFLSPGNNKRPYRWICFETVHCFGQRNDHRRIECIAEFRAVQADKSYGALLLNYYKFVDLMPPSKRTLAFGNSTDRNSGYFRSLD